MASFLLKQMQYRIAVNFGTLSKYLCIERGGEAESAPPTASLLEGVQGPQKQTRQGICRCCCCCMYVSVVRTRYGKLKYI